MRSVVVAALLTLSAASVALAETRLVFANRSEGSTAATGESTVWLGAQKMRRDQGASTTLIRLDQKKLYVVQHAAKTYVELDLPIDLLKAVPEAQRASITQLAQAMQVTAKVTPGSERKTLGRTGRRGVTTSPCQTPWAWPWTRWSGPGRCRASTPPSSSC